MNIKCDILKLAYVKRSSDESSPVPKFRGMDSCKDGGGGGGFLDLVT
jgi:hypothetical protein